MGKFTRFSNLFLSLILLNACGDGKSSFHRIPINSKGDILGSAGPETIPNWFTKDPSIDGVEGTSIDRAYFELSLKTAVEPIIVAVIDSGVDINHEDLQGQIWTNPGESGLDANGNDKATNGIDDDNNGYIDDVHGWNFLGSYDANHKPINLVHTNLEVTRELLKMKSLKLAKEAVHQDLSPDEASSLAKLNDEVIKGRKEAVEEAAASGALGSSYYYNEEVDPRALIIKDDPSDFTDHKYGNNDVLGSDGVHGTHVAGIIGASRNNSLGIDGVATAVKMMVLRAVPDGDEADKDIYNAIRYAADNGAKIINMSFGKSYSPYKNKIDEAFRYAAGKGVLIIHAAGNEGANLDKVANFPNPHGLEGGEIPNWIEVGASSEKKSQELAAAFSNYGKKSVDIFAPGVNIKSTVPSNNKYAVFSGTSMAAPVVTGVASVVMSQRRELSAPNIKALLLASVRNYPGLQVNQPWNQEGVPFLVSFDALSGTGGVVDGLAALKKAFGFY